MTVYLVKFSFVPNPVVIDSCHYNEHLCPGLHYNWFREFMDGMKDIDWVKKIACSTKEKEGIS